MPKLLLSDSGGSPLSNMGRAVQIVDRICAVAGSSDLINELQTRSTRLRRILDRRNNDKLFDWLMETLSYQGVSDRLAHGYMQRNGRLGWTDVSAGAANSGGCPKLNSYWHFEGCGYSKATGSCAEPRFRAACRLPVVKLRNGRLNQLGYSLFLFIRDIADGDLIGWLDARLQANLTDDAVALGRTAIIEPLKNVYGVSDKVLMMTFAMVLMSAPKRYTGWFEVGAAMVAIDTLVHAFLFRTGITGRLGKTHSYGRACYDDGGCASVILAIAKQIDCRKFNPSFPASFPRFIQHAIWQYCAQSGLDICNGNHIDDRKRCENSACHIYGFCDRKAPKIGQIPQ
jgi:hypothetical protein